MAIRSSSLPDWKLLLLTDQTCAQLSELRRHLAALNAWWNLRMRLFQLQINSGADLRLNRRGRVTTRLVEKIVGFAAT
jgi:hypothetical protein